MEQSFQVELVRWYYSLTRRPFLMPEDIYEHWVILAADEGIFHYRIGDEAGMTKFGDILLCPPNVKLHRKSDKPLSFLFAEFSWRNAAGQPMEPGPQLPYGKISFHRINRYSSTFDCVREMSNKETRDNFAFRQHLVTDMLFLYAAERQDEQSLRYTKDPAIQTAALYIQNHAYEPISLKELADHACLSQSQFSRRFQAAVGQSPIAYLTALRMKRARSLLIETEQTLEKIAIQCGYQNGFYLSRVFTASYGISPSEFRKSYRI